LDPEEQVSLYRDTQRKRFEELGIRQVAAFAPQWSGTVQTLAWEWLREQDEFLQRANQVAAAEQQAFSRRTLLWAKIAGVAACIAVLVAALAWLLPR
jgi:hypothetical protein